MEKYHWFQGAQLHCIAECLFEVVPRDVLLAASQELDKRAMAGTWMTDTNDLAEGLAAAFHQAVRKDDLARWLDDEKEFDHGKD